MATRLAMGAKPPKEGAGLSPDRVRYGIAKKKYQLSRGARLSGEPFMTFDEWKKKQGATSGG